MTSTDGSIGGPDAVASSTADGLRSNRDFVAVLGGQAVSALGDAITLTAMPLLVVALSGSGAMLGVVTALQLLPDLLVGLFAGALADRTDRRRLVLWCDAGRALLTMIIPVAWWTDLPTMTVVLLVAFPINICRVLSDAGLTSAIPGLVGREQLARANGMIEATLSVPYVIGPAIAGVLVAAIGAAPTLAIDAATFAFSAIAMTFVRRTLRAERPATMPRVLTDVSEGLRFAWRRPTIRLSISYWAAMTAATAALVPAISYYVTVDRRRSAELFGLIGSGWSVGYLGGALLVARLGSERVGQRMLAGSAVIGAALITMVATPWPVAFVVSGAIVGLALAVVTVSYATLRASNTPDELLGRVGSSARAVTATVTVTAALVSGAVIELTSGRGAIVAMAGVCLLVVAAFGRSAQFRQARYG